MTTTELHLDDQIPVLLPSGGMFTVYSREQTWFNDRRKRYLSQNHLTNISDLQTLDLIMSIELLCWRWTIWLSQQKDYWDDPIDEPKFSGMVKDNSLELRRLKAALGIDKVTRDKQRGEDSVANYLNNLRARAREFGIMRESQLGKALELFNQLRSVVNMHDQCTEDERIENRHTTNDVLEWIRDIAIPEYEQLDNYFRSHQQKNWVKAL